MPLAAPEPLPVVALGDDPGQLDRLGRQRARVGEVDEDPVRRRGDGERVAAVRFDADPRGLQRDRFLSLHRFDGDREVGAAWVAGLAGDPAGGRDVGGGGRAGVADERWLGRLEDLGGRGRRGGRRRRVCSRSKAREARTTMARLFTSPLDGARSAGAGRRARQAGARASRARWRDRSRSPAARGGYGGGEMCARAERTACRSRCESERPQSPAHREPARPNRTASRAPVRSVRPARSRAGGLADSSFGCPRRARL